MSQHPVKRAIESVVETGPQVVNIELECEKCGHRTRREIAMAVKSALLRPPPRVEVAQAIPRIIAEARG